MFNHMKTAALLGALSALVITIGNAISPGSLYLFTGLAILMNVGAYFFSHKVVLAMHRAREVDPAAMPALDRMVTELSEKAGIPKPKLYVIPDQQPNAFATGRNPANGVVAVTEGILRLLPERELRGVIAHEIAHIRNRDILLSTIAAVMVAIVSHAANALGWMAMFGGGRSSDSEDRGSNPIAAIALMIAAPLAATLIQLAISRSREYLADATGAELAGDPDSLARALERLHTGAARFPLATAQPATASMFIVNPLTSRGVSALFSTHPPFDERVRRLREMRLHG